MCTSRIKSSQLRIWKIQICTQLTYQKISHRSTVLTVPRGSLAIKQPFKTFGKGFTIMTHVCGDRWHSWNLNMIAFPDNFPQGGWSQLLAVGETYQWPWLWLKCRWMVPSNMKKAMYKLIIILWKMMTTDLRQPTLRTRLKTQRTTAASSPPLSRWNILTTIITIIHHHHHHHHRQFRQGLL